MEIHRMENSIKEIGNEFEGIEENKLDNCIESEKEKLDNEIIKMDEEKYEIIKQEINEEFFNPDKIDLAICQDHVKTEDSIEKYERLEEMMLETSRIKLEKEEEKNTSYLSEVILEKDQDGVHIQDPVKGIEIVEKIDQNYNESDAVKYEEEINGINKEESKDSNNKLVLQDVDEENIEIEKIPTNRIEEEKVQVEIISGESKVQQEENFESSEEIERDTREEEAIVLYDSTILANKSKKTKEEEKNTTGGKGKKLQLKSNRGRGNKSVSLLRGKK